MPAASREYRGVQLRGPEMNATPTSSDSAAQGSGLTPIETRTLLERIVIAVESNQKQGRVELMIAIVISIATLGSTWCGYQSQLWSGASSSAQTDADAAEREAEENVLLAFQLRTQHGMLLIEYWRALRSGDTKGAETFLDHMPAILQQATKASIRDGILKNPEVPGPLQRPEYRLAEDVLAKKKKEEAKRLKSEAASAGSISTTYVLRTLMFASVLFFGGIGGTFDDRRIQTALAFVALAVLLGTLGLVIPLPAYTG